MRDQAADRSLLLSCVAKLERLVLGVRDVDGMGNNSFLFHMSSPKPSGNAFPRPMYHFA